MFPSVLLSIVSILIGAVEFLHVGCMCQEFLGYPLCGPRERVGICIRRLFTALYVIFAALLFLEGLNGIREGYL